ncbi:unnamed protein product [Rotaria sp. Silwood1]|nr:unnamed protein product [Rotaria sp. Silwood1]
MSRTTSGSTNRSKSGNEGKKDKSITNGHQQKNNNKKEEVTSSDDDEPIRAPIQLKIEFVNSVMTRQWALAKKLCHFMLMYEPNNSEAKQFSPLIDYMLTEEQSSSSDDDDTSDDDSSGSDSSSDSSSNEEEKQNDTVEIQTSKPINASLSNKCPYHNAPTDFSPIPQSPIEESDQVILTSISLPAEAQRSNSFLSDSIDILNEKSSNIQTVSIEQCLSNNESSNQTTKVVVTSPSFHSDLSLEQNDSIDPLNSSSLSFLQTKQRRIDHRRNKSEPFKSASTEDIPSTTVLELSSTSNESPLSNNTNNQTRRKLLTNDSSNNISSLKTIKSITQEKSSSSSSTPRKKKPWYNVIKPFIYWLMFM